jgi:hypothetical protein
MEGRFGHDFSRVRLHVDARAAAAAEAVDSFAYTVGRDIVFGPGQYAPETRAGRRLLAHELAHVVQQGGGAVPGAARLPLSPPHDRFEQEADRAAEALMAGNPGPAPRSSGQGAGELSRSPMGLQRSVRFVETKPREEINPAEAIVTGGVAGNTDFVLNGVALGGGATVQTARQALNTPGLDSHAPRKGDGVSCWFNSEPHNEVSYDMRVLSPDAWTFETTRRNLDALFGLGACQSAGNATLVVNGVPSDEAQRGRTRAHENHHVTDYRTIFNDVLVPWDRRVAAVHEDNPTAEGTNPADCENNLYRTHVGPDQTPDDIARRLIDEINGKATAFHNSPAGRRLHISNAQADRGCNRVTVDALPI